MGRKKRKQKRNHHCDYKHHDDYKQLHYLIYYYIGFMMFLFSLPLLYALLVEEIMLPYINIVVYYLITCLDICIYPVFCVSAWFMMYIMIGFAGLSQYILNIVLNMMSHLYQSASMLSMTYLACYLTLILVLYLVSLIWFWKDEHNMWQRYPFSVSIKLNVIRNNKSICYEFENRVYIITKKTTSRGYQQNFTTHYKREIKRINVIRSVLQNLREIFYIKPSFNNINGYFMPWRVYSFAYDRFYETMRKSKYDVIWIIDVTNNEFEKKYVQHIKSKNNCTGHATSNKNIIDDMLEHIQSKNNEQFLWHGSSKKKIIDGILRTNYDASKNVRSAYGKGTYFAKHAELSAHYCVDDDDKYMLLNQVFVGKYTHSDSYNVDEYDSMVDEIHDPLVYVIPNRYCALPKYLIKFRKNKLKNHSIVNWIIIIFSIFWILGSGLVVALKRINCMC